MGDDFEMGELILIYRLCLSALLLKLMFFISVLCEQMLGQNDFFKQMFIQNELLIFMLYLDRTHV